MTSPLINMVAPSPRDYLIANAPAEPQKWFIDSFVPPEWPAEMKQLATRMQAFSKDAFRRAFAIRNIYTSDKLEVTDGPEVRECIDALDRREILESEYKITHKRALMAQWPVAWADAVMKARGE